MSTVFMQIANLYDAPRWTGIAATDLDLCEVVKVTTGAVTGQRYLARVTASGDVQKPGLWGVAWKVSSDPYQVSTSLSTVPTRLGSRVVTILSGDAIVQVGVGAIIEVDASMLHSSLDANNSGVTPTVGQSLGIATSGSKAKFSTAASTSLAGVGTTIHVARVFRTFGTKLLIELVNDAKTT